MGGPDCRDPEFMQLIDYVTQQDFVTWFSQLSDAELQAFFLAAAPTTVEVDEVIKPLNSDSESIQGTQPSVVSDSQDGRPTAPDILSDGELFLEE